MLEATDYDELVVNLLGWQVWEVSIINNYYTGKYYNVTTRPFPVVASSENEARQVALDNADEILKVLMTKKINNRWMVSRRNPLTITANDIRAITDGTKHGRRSTVGHKPMFTPHGIMQMKISNGYVIQVRN